MRTLIIALALFLFGGAAHAETASAEESAVVASKDGMHQWVHPGHHPLAGNREAVMNDASRRTNFVKLGLSGSALDAVMTATAAPGQMRDLVDGEMLGNQLYQNGRMVTNIVVAFGNQRVNRTAERWTIPLPDGSIVEVTLPYICHNLSVRVVPPPPGPACGFVVSEIQPGDEHLQFALMGDYQPDVCFAVAQIASPQVADSAIDWKVLPTHCPEAPCAFNGFAEFYHLPLTQSGGMPVSAGFVVFRVSAKFAKNPNNILVECLDHGKNARERGLTRHTCGIDVRSTDYHKIKGARWDNQATIFYRPEDIPAAWNFRKLWWAMPDAQGHCNPDD